MERIKIELNNDMTFVVENDEKDGTITKYIAMGTGEDIDYNDCIMKETLSYDTFMTRLN